MAIKIIFGLPGSGKTTFAAKICYDNLRKHIKTYANFDLVGAVRFNDFELGRYKPYEGVIVLDEAGIRFNSRKHRDLPEYTLEYFKTYRKYGIADIWVLSQAPDDMDLAIRRLADEAYYVRKAPFGFSSLKALVLSFDVDEVSHQPTIFWQWSKKFPKLFYRPRYYNMFNSWDRDYEKGVELRYRLSGIESGKKVAKIALNGGDV